LQRDKMANRHIESTPNEKRTEGRSSNPAAEKKEETVGGKLGTGGSLKKSAKKKSFKGLLRGGLPKTGADVEKKDGPGGAQKTFKQEVFI